MTNSDFFLPEGNTGRRCPEALLQVLLQTPVAGAKVTTVHDPDTVQNALVDPKDAAYSEFPGKADTLSLVWLAVAAFSLACFVAIIPAYYSYRQRGEVHRPLETTQ